MRFLFSTAVILCAFSFESRAAVSDQSSTQTQQPNGSAVICSQQFVADFTAIRDEVSKTHQALKRDDPGIASQAKRTSQACIQFVGAYRGLQCYVSPGSKSMFRTDDFNEICVELRSLSEKADEYEKLQRQYEEMAAELNKLNSGKDRAICSEQLTTDFGTIVTQLSNAKAHGEAGNLNQNLEEARKAKASCDRFLQTHSGASCYFSSADTELFKTDRVKLLCSLLDVMSRAADEIQGERR